MRRVGLLAVALVVASGCGGSDRMTSSSQEPLVRVARVVGMTMKRADAVLEAQGLRADTGWVNSGWNFESQGERKPCAGVPGPGASVSDQDPYSGIHVPPGTLVHLKPACPPEDALPICPDRELTLRPFPDGGAGNDWVFVNVEHVSGPPCLLEGDLSLSLEKDGQPLPRSDNNTSTVHISSPLGVAETFIAKWTLHGCARHATDVARFQGVVGAAEQEVCASEGKPGLALPGDVTFRTTTSRRDYARALARIRR